MKPYKDSGINHLRTAGFHPSTVGLIMRAPPTKMVPSALRNPENPSWVGGNSFFPRLPTSPSKASICSSGGGGGAADVPLLGAADRCPQGRASELGVPHRVQGAARGARLPRFVGGGGMDTSKGSLLQNMCYVLGWNERHHLLSCFSW